MYFIIDMEVSRVNVKQSKSKVYNYQDYHIMKGFKHVCKLFMQRGIFLKQTIDEK